MKNKTIVRHGDMVVMKVSKPASSEKNFEVETLTLGLGEVTGHSHKVLPIGKAKITVSGYDSAEVKNLPLQKHINFEVSGGEAVIMHEEHGPITLTEGHYVRIVQRAYNPFTKSLENVKD